LAAMRWRFVWVAAALGAVLAAQSADAQEGETAAERLKRVKEGAGEGAPIQGAEKTFEEEEAERQRKQTIEDAKKLREDARQKAMERIKQQKEGVKPGKPEKADPLQEKLKGLSHQEAQRVLAEEKRKQRMRILEEHNQERVRLSQQNDIVGRRILEEMKPPLHCSDGEKNDEETDVDCGGNRCREETYIERGMEFYKTCGFAQACQIDKDCTSHRCENNKCAAREALEEVSEAALLRNMHTAFFQIAGESGRTHLTSGEIERFVKLSVSPDGQPLRPAQEELFKNAVNAFVQTQGLVDSSTELLYGFLLRGSCLKSVKALIASAQQPQYKEL